MIRKINNGKLVKTLAIILSIVLILCFFSFLCSIHFRLDYYIFSTVLRIKGHYYPDYDDFDENKEHFEILINEIQSYIEETPNFYNKYNVDNIYANNSDGIYFVKKESSYTSLYYDVYTPSRADWDEVRKCLSSFPERGFETIEVDKDYPNYIFFPCKEYSPRIIMYTGGEKPYKYINELWNKYEYVEVVKLGYGWYDIRPQGVK